MRLNKETVNKQCGWTYPLIRCARSNLQLCVCVPTPQPVIHFLLLLHFSHQSAWDHKGVLLMFGVDSFIVRRTKQLVGWYRFVSRSFALRTGWKHGTGWKIVGWMSAFRLLTVLWRFRWCCASDLLFNQFRFHVNWCREAWNPICKAVSAALCCAYTFNNILYVNLSVGIYLLLFLLLWSYYSSLRFLTVLACIFMHIVLANNNQLILYFRSCFLVRRQMNGMWISSFSISTLPFLAYTDNLWSWINILSTTPVLPICFSSALLTVQRVFAGCTILVDTPMRLTNWCYRLPDAMSEPWINDFYCFFRWCLFRFQP